MCAKESIAEELENNLPKGLEFIVLKGHFFDMIGIKTEDDVYFLGDSLFSKDTINKYHLFYIYDVRRFLETLDYLNELEGKIFIPSHCEATDNIKGLIQINKNKVQEILNLILNICVEEKNFEEILKIIFDTYNLAMNPNQYVLVGSTIKSYLSYLHEENKIIYEFKNNQMVWKKL